jgi:hypothetical protein
VANRDQKDGLVEQYRQGALAFIERGVRMGKAAGVSDKALEAKIDCRALSSRDQP